MPSPEDPAFKQLLTRFSRLLQSGQYSDLAICSTDRKFAVHKTIVCTQSTFFNTACASSFRESKSDVIELLDDDPNAVDCMIQYLYTLTYPEETTESSPKPTGSFDHITFGQITNDLEMATHDRRQVTIDDAEIRTVLDEDQNHGVNAQESSPAQDESNDDQSAATCNMSLSLLYQDLQVYVLGEKYGIPDLKKKAAHHFEKVLQDADLTVEVFNIIQGVYSMTMPQDRVLRDILTTKVYGEIQHWIQDKEFMERLRGEGDFSVDLLSYTIKENLKQVGRNDIPAQNRVLFLKRAAREL